MSAAIATWDTAPAERPPDSISNPTPLDKLVYVVGWVHTHPPSFYCIDGLYVGPSTNDFNYSIDVMVPGFVYDYIATEYDDEENHKGGGIPPNHPLGSPAIIYTIPPDRRPLP